MIFIVKLAYVMETVKTAKLTKIYGGSPRADIFPSLVRLTINLLLTQNTYLLI